MVWETKKEVDELDELNKKFEMHIIKSGLYENVDDWCVLCEEDFEWGLYEYIVNCSV